MFVTGLQEEATKGTEKEKKELRRLFVDGSSAQGR